MTRSYEEIGRLGDLYLEDSYLLDVEESRDAVTFTVEAVIVESSPWWRPKKADEQYCYRDVRIRFPRPRAVTWRERQFRPIPAPDGLRPDFGNIDVFTEVSPGHYSLLGEWGHVDIESDAPEVELVRAPAPGDDFRR